MDINDYIKIKIIPFFDSSETKYIRGIVFEKSLLDRKMKWEVENARILLFNSSIDVDFFSKFGSFDSFISQEKSYFKKIVKNIMKLKPDVIFIEKTINHYAAECLQQHKIPIFIKVKKSLISRIARLTRCKPIKDLSSLDKLNQDAYIGKCSMLYVKKIDNKDKNNEFDLDSTKDYLYIEGCNPIYGVTLTISGPDQDQLKLLKKCLKSLFKIGRNLLLENSLIAQYKDFPVNSINLDFESLLKPNFILYTKANFIKRDIKTIPDFQKNPYFIKDLKEKDSFENPTKLDYYAEICGFPSLKNIVMYSKEDISLGAYLILKSNSLNSQCITCKKHKAFHVSFYYNGSKYIKISTDFLSENSSFNKTNSLQLPINVNSPQKSLNASPRSSKSSIFSIIPIFKSSNNINLTINTEKNSPNTSQNPIKDIIKSQENLDFKKERSNTLISSRGAKALKRLSSKRSSLIKSYMECLICKVKITEEKALDHEYLEYSLASFLQGLFSYKERDNSLKFSLDDEIGLFIHENARCNHPIKAWVFNYKDILVKFSVNVSKYFKMELKGDFLDYKAIIMEKEAILIEGLKEEYYKIFKKTLLKLNLIVEGFIKEEIGDNKAFYGYLSYEIRKIEGNLKERLLEREFDSHTAVEEEKIMVCRDIIALFDVFLIIIKRDLEKYRAFDEKSENLVSFLLKTKKKEFFPSDLIDYIKNKTFINEMIKVKNKQKSMQFLDYNKFSLEITDYPLEFELNTPEKFSDLYSKLFLEEIFRFKFKEDQTIQFRHLEIEFKEFKLLTKGQSIEINENILKTPQLFVKLS